MKRLLKSLVPAALMKRYKASQMMRHHFKSHAQEGEDLILLRFFVRATLQDLDIIEEAVKVLNIIPPQINIKAKFAEVGQNDKRAVGFDWYLGNYLMGGKSIGGQAGTAPSYVGSPSAANPSGVFPGPGTSPGVGGPGAIAQSASDSLLTGGLRNSANAPAIATLTGILTDPQFRVVTR